MPTVDEARITITGDVTGVSGSLSTVEKTANKAATGVSSSFQSELGKVSSATAALSGQVGGHFAQIVGLANSAIRPLGEVSLGLGAIGLSALAVGGAVVAVSSLGSAAAGAAKDLHSLGIVVDPTSTAELAAYSEGQKQLAVSLDQAKVAAGSGLAEAIGIIDSAFAQDLGFLTKYASKMAEIGANTTGLKTQLDALAAAVGVDVRAAAAKQLYVEMLNNQIEMEPRVQKEFMAQLAARLGLTAAEQKGLDVAHDRATANIQLATQEKAATVSLQEEFDRLRAIQLGPRAEILAAYSAEINKIQALEKASGNHALAQKAMVVAEQEAITALQKVDDAEQEAARAGQRYWSDVSTAMAVSVQDAEVTIDQSLRQIKQNMADYYKQMASAELDAAAQAVGAISQANDLVVQGFADRVAAGEHLNAQEITRANAALERQKVLSITAAGLQATLSGMGMVTALAPFIGPAAIPVGVTIAAGMFAAATASIMAGSPFNYQYGSKGSDSSMNTQGDANGDGSVDAADQGGAGLGGLGPNGGRGTTSRSRGPSGGGAVGVSVSVDPRLTRLRISRDSRHGKRMVR